MPVDPEKKDEAIYRVETVPPPPGEGDVYNAPTKVGPMSDAVIDAMRKAGVPEDRIPASGATAKEKEAPAEVKLPRLYDAVDDEAATLLHASARRVPVGRTNPSMAIAVPESPPTESRLPSRAEEARMVVIAIMAALLLGALAAFVTSLN
jgi:hypothetical protein